MINLILLLRNIKKSEGIFDLDKLINKRNDLEKMTVNEKFWDNKTSAHSILQKIKLINNKLDKIKMIDNENELLNFHLEVIANENVISLESLCHLDEFVKSVDSRIVIRGLRVLSDFEYEFKMALMNRKLDETITTLFMMPHEKYTHVSSSLIKEVALLGGDIRDYVSDFVLKKINDKINEN